MRKGKIQKHINDLGHLDTWMRISAANALAEVGQAAVPALTEALKDKDKYWAVRDIAAEALKGIKEK